MMLAPPFQQHMRRWMSLQDAVGDTMALAVAHSGVLPRDLEANKVAKDLERPGAWLCAKTLTDHACRAGVSRYALGSRSELLASTKWVQYLYGMRTAIEGICDDVVFRGGDNVALYIIPRYDKTPLKTEGGGRGRFRQRARQREAAEAASDREGETEGGGRGRLRQRGRQREDGRTDGLTDGRTGER